MSVNLQRFFNKFPVIDLGDIKLRDLMLSDKEKYFEMMSDFEVVKFQSDEDIPKNITETEEEIKFWGGLFYRKQSIFWAIAETNNDEFIGTVGFNNWNFTNRRGEISYDLMRHHWRKGIMTRALTNALMFGFREMNLYRIEARTLVENIPSQKILEKIGFKKEGVQIGYRIIKDQPADVALYAIVKPNFISIIN